MGLLKLLEEAAKPNNPEREDERHYAAAVAQACGAVRDVLAAAPNDFWHSADGRFCLYRLLLMVTWPSQAVSNSPPASCQLASALGRLFELVSVKHHMLRHIANAWARWCAGHLTAIFGAWKRAVDALGPSERQVALEAASRAARRAAAEEGDDSSDYCPGDD